METTDEKRGIIETMFKAGAHFGYARTRRHPSVMPYIFGAKNRVEIFDLEKTYDLLSQARAFLSKIASEGGIILFAGGKKEAGEIIKNAALSVSMPYVDGRWIGGTITNFNNIRKRVEKMEDLISKREKGEFVKYTKKERLLIDRDIENLKRIFSGLTKLTDLPKALFIIDHKKEHTATREARSKKIPIVSLCSSDCDIKEVEYPMVANDSSISSIRFFVDEIVKAIQSGKTTAKV